MILAACSFSSSYVEMTRLTTYRPCKGEIEVNLTGRVQRIVVFLSGIIHVYNIVL